MKKKLLLSASLLIVANAFSQVPTTNLIKEYTFTNGSLQNTVTPGTDDLTTVATTSTFTQTADPLNINNAITLNGEQFLGGQHPTNALIESDFSISFWIKTSHTGVNSQYLFRQYGIRNTNSNAGIRAYLRNGTIVFAGNYRLGTSNYNAETYLTSSNIADDNWHHVVITGAYKHRLHPNNAAYTFVKYDYKMYIDNVLDTSGSTPEGFDYDQDVYLFEGNPELKIGSVQFQDSMDSFRVYTSALDVTDVNNLYKEMVLSYTLNTNAIGGTISTDVHSSTGDYTSGTVVTLTATPTIGYQFDGWSGDATGTTNPLPITMNADKNVTAMFSAIQQTLTTTAVNGTVALDIQPTNGTHNYGTQIEITATPTIGYQFDGWSGDATGTTNPLPITMDANKNVTAMFSAVQQTLTTTAVNGTVALDIQPTNGTYDYGTEIEITATPATGYQFDGWSGDATGITNPLTITMDADKNVTAMFSAIQQTLTTTAVNGTVALDIQPTNGIYIDGTVVALTATPDTGYQFDGWSGDATGTTNPLTITMDADKNISAMFSAIQQTLTTTAVNGTVALDIQPTNGTYDYGTQIEITATPATGYQFDGWSGDATGTTNPISITMNADKNITAIFSTDNLSTKDNTIEGLEIKIENQTIKTNSPEITVKVFNSVGKQVNNQDLEGLYIVIFNNNQGAIQVEKIMIQQ